MKSLSTVLLFLLLTFSFNASAVQSGVYVCGGPEKKVKIIYSITKIQAGEIELPYLEVAKTFYDAQGFQMAEKNYLIKGVPSVHIGSQGQESLMLGQMILSLTDGKPSCAK